MRRVNVGRQLQVAPGRFVLLAICMVVLLFATACDIIAPDAATCDEPGFLFSDNFDDGQDCGWALYERSGAAVEISEGGLNISSSQPGQLWWSNPGNEYEDVEISAQVQQLSGPNDNAFGLICRYQNDQNFYVFLISGDGYYAIGKYQGGSDEVIYLTDDQQFQQSDAINQGVAINQIRASCVGDQLALTVNGLPLITVTDPTFVLGDVGVAASTLQPGTAEIEFDNIRVSLP